MKHESSAKPLLKSAADYAPELKTSVYATATVRHLLDMTVSIGFSEDYADPNGDMPAYRRAVGWDPGGAVGGSSWAAHCP